MLLTLGWADFKVTGLSFAHDDFIGGGVEVDLDLNGGGLALGNGLSICLGEGAEKTRGGGSHHGDGWHAGGSSKQKRDTHGSRGRQGRRAGSGIHGSGAGITGRHHELAVGLTQHGLLGVPLENNLVTNSSVGKPIATQQRQRMSMVSEEKDTAFENSFSEKHTFE